MLDTTIHRDPATGAVMLTTEQAAALARWYLTEGEGLLCEDGDYAVARAIIDAWTGGLGEGIPGAISRWVLRNAPVVRAAEAQEEAGRIEENGEVSDQPAWIDRCSDTEGADVTARALARVEQARARADAATPGPWVDIAGQDNEGEPGHVGIKANGGNKWSIARVWGDGPATEVDAALIARARADVPLLADAALVLVRLVAMREDSAIDGWPWWQEQGPDGLPVCIGCRRGPWGRGRMIRFDHIPDCPAMAADAIIRRMAEVASPEAS